MKFFDPEISIIFYIFELPESKYGFSRKCLCVCMYVSVYMYVRVCVCVCACVCACVYVRVCNKFVRDITRNWPEISSLSLAGTWSLFWSYKKSIFLSDRSDNIKSDNKNKEKYGKTENNFFFPGVWILVRSNPIFLRVLKLPIDPYFDQSIFYIYNI